MYRMVSTLNYLGFPLEYAWLWFDLAHLSLNEDRTIQQGV